MFLNYPKDIRKAIYTTNAIVFLKSVILMAVTKLKVFPSDQVAFQVVYLATQQTSKRWSIPIFVAGRLLLIALWLCLMTVSAGI